MYKEDLALNKQQWLIRHKKTPKKQTELLLFTSFLFRKQTNKVILVLIPQNTHLDQIHTALPINKST